MEIPGGGGSKAKVPSVGGVWIFFGTTQWNKLMREAGRLPRLKWHPRWQKGCSKRRPDLPREMQCVYAIICW